MCVWQGFSSDLTVPVKGESLNVHFQVPKDACCTVVFAFAGGSRSRRSLAIMKEFTRLGIAVASFDLLTEREQGLKGFDLDTEMLAGRLSLVIDSIKKRDDIRGLSIGSFSSSVGTASVLRTSVNHELEIEAIVSFDGRPDLAWDILEKVQIPTLLLVGSNSYGLLALNESSYDKMNCRKRLELVSDTSPSNQDQSTYHVIAEQARDWFLSNMKIKKAAKKLQN